jgi:hypothetical protein
MVPQAVPRRGASLGLVHGEKWAVRGAVTGEPRWGKMEDRGGYSPEGEISGEGLVQMVWVLLLKMH